MQTKFAGHILAVLLKCWYQYAEASSEKTKGYKCYFSTYVCSFHIISVYWYCNPAFEV